MEGANCKSLLQVKGLLTLQGHLCYDTKHTDTDLCRLEYLNIVNCTDSQEL